MEGGREDEGVRGGGGEDGWRKRGRAGKEDGGAKWRKGEEEEDGAVLQGYCKVIRRRPGIDVGHVTDGNVVS